MDWSLPDGCTRSNTIWKLPAGLHVVVCSAEVSCSWLDVVIVIGVVRGDKTQLSRVTTRIPFHHHSEISLLLVELSPQPQPAFLGRSEGINLRRVVAVILGSETLRDV